jgi:hypothetical protein
MRITTSARSGLGQAMALAIVAIPLIIIGLYLALGDVAAGDTFKMQGVINTVFSSENMQETGRVFSENLSAHFRRFGRVELIVYYGLAIFFGFAIQGLLGRFLRSYRFAFLPREGVIERRAMWLLVPGWLGVWAMVAVLLYLIVNTSVTIKIWVQFWVLFGVFGAGVAAWMFWAWAPGLLAGRSVRVPRWNVRISLWLLVLPALLLVMSLVGWACGWHVALGIPVPVRGLAAVGGATVCAAVVWIYVPWLGRRNWFVPGFRKRVAWERIKRMEVQGAAEGGTELVITFGDDWTWVICRSAPRQLQRVGGALGRVMGLARRDLVTWSAGA